MNNQSYYISSSQSGQEGPYPIGYIIARYRSQGFAGDALIWTEGWAEWKSLNNFLNEYFTANSASDNPVPPPLTHYNTFSQTRTAIPFNGYTFFGAIKKCFSQYVDFQGRATRSEYWFFTLFLVIMHFVFYFLGGMLAYTNKWLFSLLVSLEFLFILAILLPSWAVSCRRLHDIGKSGWFLLLGLIPFFGSIILIILFCMDSQPGTNKYGVSEKYPNS